MQEVQNLCSEGSEEEGASHHGSGRRGVVPVHLSEFPAASEKVALYVLWGARCRWV